MSGRSIESANRIEATLRREARNKVIRGATERTDRVLSTIKEELDARATIYDLSPEAYRSLLGNPDLYQKFIEIWQSNHQ